MAAEKSGLVEVCLRTCLFFLVPIILWLQDADKYLSMPLGGSSFLAVILDVLRQRRKCMPFPVLLILVWAAQATCCMVAFQGNLGSDIDSVGRTVALRGTLAANSDSTPIKTMSIVMAAHNEHKYMTRTIDSILEKTPLEVLIEIIVVDDGSTPPLQPLVQNYPLVKVLRHESRRGLIKSKTEGGNLAKGDMIMFLDAHINPLPGWYAPLLRHTNINYKRVVVPLIPILDEKTWEPQLNAVGVKMMFDWSLFFNWFEDGNDLVPCMSGGLFAITRAWWHESGEYDYGMNMWGAENIEQSIRIWLCGGEIMVARDSQVSHVFRRKFPYAINNTEIYINKVRTVEAWFDDYKRNYYAVDTAAKSFIPLMGDISSRLALKKKLQCKPFSWYVNKFEDVFRSKNMLDREMFLIRDVKSGMCLVPSAGDKSHLREVPCNRESEEQRWVLANSGRNIQNPAVEKCLDADAGQLQRAGSKVLLYPCFATSAMQEWTVRDGQPRWSNICVKG
eukprot:TRINITY_DN396_c0_g1_i4.p1 TRINITY_DN396_c0_g1~~TRINITY_DN396_c0_g1_i4.p1  ORF type:complete len:511 (+),score=65.55 TRINITY_DN396_c0_g1_i4:22-1533(+)